MQKTAVLLLSLFLFTASQAQTSIKDFVQQTAVAIPTIDPDSTDYTDLEAIGNAIGDARIVMLGEQAHGDAPAYLAKTRLVKYLHEKKGFNVLAFEGDFFSLNRGWELLPKDSARMVAFMQNNIFPIWTACDACFPLYRQYIPATFQTATPLQVTGFDPQMLTGYAGHLAHELDSVLRAWQLPFTTTPEYNKGFVTLIDSLRGWWYYKPADNLYDQCVTWLQRVRQEAAQKISPDDFWLQVIDNLIEENKHYRYLKDKKKYESLRNVRDTKMAGNLAWLHRVKYPNEKIIVWAHSMHISKVTPASPGNRIKAVHMGGEFTNDPALAATTYVLGFSSYEGTAEKVFFPPVVLPKPKKESFENWVQSKGRYAFVDFKSYQRQHPGTHVEFYMSGHNHYNVEDDWTNIFDGIFYIDKMYTCKKFDRTTLR